MQNLFCLYIVESEFIKIFFDKATVYYQTINIIKNAASKILALFDLIELVLWFFAVYIMNSRLAVCSSWH